jgi:hypothetical protein
MSKVGVATYFLQFLTWLFGIGILAFLIWEPQVEGRNVGKVWFEIYFQDPFLAFVYVGSIPCFIGILRGIKFLGRVRNGKVFSSKVVRDIKVIRQMALLTMGLAFIGQGILLLNNSDDRAGGMAIGMFIHFLALLVIAVTTVIAETVTLGMKGNPREE